MSDSQKSSITETKNRSIQLGGTGLKAGSLIEQSLANLNEQQVNSLMAKASEEALRLEVKSREQNLDYVVGKKATEDHIDTFNLLAKNGGTTRQKVISDIKTGAGNMRIESKSGATCFVASVAYNDPNHPDVIILRKYRDTVLTKSNVGRIFIKIYWKIGPKIARIVNTSDSLKSIAKFLISRVVWAIK